MPIGAHYDRSRVDVRSRRSVRPMHGRTPVTDWRGAIFLAFREAGETWLIGRSPLISNGP